MSIMFIIWITIYMFVLINWEHKYYGNYNPMDIYGGGGWEWSIKELGFDSTMLCEIASCLSNLINIKYKTQFIPVSVICSWLGISYGNQAITGFPSLIKNVVFIFTWIYIFRHFVVGATFLRVLNYLLFTVSYMVTLCLKRNTL